jgi:hypothetical protein
MYHHHDYLNSTHHCTTTIIIVIENFRSPMQSLKGQLRYRCKLASYEADMDGTTRSYSYTNDKTAINSIDHHIGTIFDAYVSNYPK